MIETASIINHATKSHSLYSMKLEEEHQHGMDYHWLGQLLKSCMMI